MKVIDFGSVCVIRLTSGLMLMSNPAVIVLSRNHSIFGVWVALFSSCGQVTFQNESVAGMLARIIWIIGEFPDWMMEKGCFVGNFFFGKNLIHETFIKKMRMRTDDLVFLDFF